mmetsp:Transcript_16713/g.36634  ORF Transcript_16713/g.36634 Transcript_16713/m.36634 type:complete len:255 (-) Transcript_16713:1413-2177(-)
MWTIPSKASSCHRCSRSSCPCRRAGPPTCPGAGRASHPDVEPQGWNGPFAWCSHHMCRCRPPSRSSRPTGSRWTGSAGPCRSSPPQAERSHPCLRKHKHRFSSRESLIPGRMVKSKMTIRSRLRASRPPRAGSRELHCRWLSRRAKHSRSFPQTAGAPPGASSASDHRHTACRKRTTRPTMRADSPPRAPKRSRLSPPLPDGIRPHSLPASPPCGGGVSVEAALRCSPPIASTQSSRSRSSSHHKVAHCRPSCA